MRQFSVTGSRALLTVLGILLFSSCPEAGNNAEAGSDQSVPDSNQPTPSEVRMAALNEEYESFSLAEGACDASAFVLELGDGKEREMQILEAYAQPKLAITSLKGDVVTTRSGSAFTLHFANYEMDLDDIGANPTEEQAKLELVLITKDKTNVSEGTYRTAKKGNLVAGPNLFYGGRAYPMKDNFIGGVKLTSIDEEYVCGEIRVRSKFDVSIQGTFKARLLEPVPAEGE